MSSTTLRIVLFVSCAHALVHVYELSLPSAEQQIADEYQVGTDATGVLGTCWRLPWGLGALGAGWLVDRFGSRRMLTCYLLGCAATCALAASVQSLPMLFVVMFLMGTCASIYHPAGLALISHETTAETRTRALGLHGIFGSAGIGAAPLLAGIVLSAGLSWRQYYWVLVLPGLILGLVFARKRGDDNRATPKTTEDDRQQDHEDWRSYFALTAVAMFSGFVYSGFLHFLPRYLNNANSEIVSASRQSIDHYQAAGVLLVGCVGQYLAGRFARAKSLERDLMFVALANVPCLLWMAVAEGSYRMVSASLFALVHFMNQPIYNSLIAKYTPRRRRSLCYGFSFAMGLGVGGIGTSFAGFVTEELYRYAILAFSALLAAVIGGWLWRRNRPRG